MKFFIFSSPYSIFSDAFHTHFDTHLIGPDYGFPVLHSPMSMTLGKLKATFAVKVFEKESTSGYTMIIPQVFEVEFQCCWRDVKLKVFDNEED